MLTEKDPRPMAERRALLFVLFIASGILLSGFVDASRAIMSMNGTLTKSFTSIIPESAKTVSEAELSPTDTMLTEITIEVNARAIAPELSVQKHDSRPAGVAADAPGVVYRYIVMYAENLEDSNIKSATIKFKIEKSWLEHNGLVASYAALYRYAGGVWNKLDTTQLDDDVLYVYYDATTPGFSYFAITASPAAATTTTTPRQEPPASEAGAWMPQLGSWWALGILAAVLIVAAIALVSSRRQPVVKRRRRARRRLQKA